MLHYLQNGQQTNIQLHLTQDKEIQVQHKEVTYDQTWENYQHQQEVDITLMDGTMEIQK